MKNDKIIPAGEYDVELTYSKKFSSEFPYRYFYFVPLLKNVPKRKGIRIRIGDYYRDCSGSILLGKYASIPTESVDESTFAYESFMHYLRRRNIMKFKLIIEEKDTFRYFLEVCSGHSWFNHVILITLAKLDHFVYKTKKLWLKYYNVQKKS